MHYTVDYTRLGDNELVKHNAAIADIIEYMGQERFDKVTAELKQHTLTLEQFAFYASFAGVQGYPVEAWYNHCYPL